MGTYTSTHIHTHNTHIHPHIHAYTYAHTHIRSKSFDLEKPNTLVCSQHTRFNNLQINVDYYSRAVCLTVMSTISYLLVATISFDQLSYKVSEKDGEVQVMLVLSNPSSTNITIEIVNMNINAMGESSICP